MKRNLIAVSALMIVLCSGCSEVNDVKIPEPGSVSENYQGSMVVSFGNGESETGTSVITTDETEKTENKKTEADETRPPETVTSQAKTTTKPAQTTAEKKTETTAPVTEAKPVTSQTTVTTAVQTLPTTLVTLSEEEIKKDVYSKVNDLVTDGEYVQAAIMMNDNVDYIGGIQYDPINMLLSVYFDEAVKYYYDAAAAYYKKQADNGKSCLTGFDGYNGITAEIDTSYLKDSVPENYKDCSEIAVVRCNDKEIVVYIEIPGYVAYYPR